MKSNTTNNNMKRISLLFIISLFITDVFGDKNEIDRVSVTDGGSVTLHAHLTDLKRVDVMEWRFNDNLIAIINREANDTRPVYDSDERFTGRLEMNPQTGDLTITNIRSEHTGDYKLEINGDKTITNTFSVSLSPKVKTVINKDFVSLHIDVSEKQRNDKIYWKIKHKNSLIAEIITQNGKISTPFIDERFRDRLKLNDQTGDLIITNMKNEDSGPYEADVTIGSNTHTIHKTFSYTESSTGLSSSVIAGIIVGVLLIVAVVVGRVIYRRPKKKHLQASRTVEALMETNYP